MKLSTEHNAFSPSTIANDTSDVAILEYLLCELRRLLTLPSQNENNGQPVIHFVPELQERIHRVVLYKSPDAFTKQALPFVGFISKKKATLTQEVVDEVAAIDQTLVLEFMQNPKLLSYSSLEVSDGNWCNLVVFDSVDAKIHIKQSSSHQHGAYHMAPLYYEWIRLHNGIILHHEDHDRLSIDKTKFYTFHQASAKPSSSEYMFTQPTPSFSHVGNKTGVVA